MLEAFFLLFVAVVASGILAFVVRAVVIRLLEIRDERLKRHLDWVNPEPQIRRRRKSFLRY